jgi:hypothetical protein
VPDAGTQAITYVEHPIRFDHLNFDIAKKMLFTKYEHWRYEEEIRMCATLKEKSSNYYFYNFGIAFGCLKSS